MTYVTQQGLVDRFGNDELLAIGDRDQDEALDADVIAEAIADAGDLVDSYIGKKYALPLATVPSRLERVAADLARYFLYPSNPPDDVRQAYEDAVAFLKDVAAGRAVLDVAGDEPDVAADEVQIEGPDRVFSRTNMEGY